MKGLISNIQRFSLHDGPGIRTTIFLKGCNLNCKWCHNPETIGLGKELMFNEEKCVGCGQCFKICPVGAHEVVEDKHIINKKLCCNCGKCAEVCYTNALTMIGDMTNVMDVMNEILQDKDYYTESTGGVTISGGEPFMQIDFAKAILGECKKHNINTAIETNFATSWSNIEKIIPVIDLFMIDIKLMDDKEHRKWTGLSNTRILENIKRLDAYDKNIIIRTPIIPNVNNNENVVREISQFVSELKHVKYYELLNYNPLGENKYTALRIPYEFLGENPFSDKEMEILGNVAKQNFDRVKIG